MSNELENQYKLIAEALIALADGQDFDDIMSFTGLSEKGVLFILEQKAIALKLLHNI